MELVENGVCAVKGINVVGKNIGIKKQKKDFGVIYSETICTAAGVFTKNEVKGAPLYVTTDNLKDGKAQAIVVNSGVANVCTGKKGIEDATSMTSLVADELGIKKKDVLVASTGLIGAYLPMDKIENGVKGIKEELSTHGSLAAEAILTTDTIKKEIAVYSEGFIIGGIAKGSGMIHPNMATMLSFITTDAKIDQGNLKKMLNAAVDKSFNMVNVDMDTSTSDMVLILATGSVKVDKDKFQEALDFVCLDLAKKIAKDGEGATKFIEVQVNGASSEDDAKKVAKSIVNSNLLKCAVYGGDPNWGRVMCAIGNSSVKIDESKISIYFDEEKIVGNGVSADFDNKKVIGIMKKDTLKITVSLGSGKHKATAFGCDLTEKYIDINAHYHT